jgi:hypothetical protein
MATKQFEAVLADYEHDHHPLKCDACGRFIPWNDLYEGHAVRHFLTPDSQFTSEEYETLCAKHK